MTLKEARERLRLAEKEIRESQERQMNFTDEQLEAIKAAVLPDRGDWELIKAELTRTRPQFAEGQVFWSETTYAYHQSVKKELLPGDRPLTLTEHGPAVRALRDFVEGLTFMHDINGAADAKRALAAFDAEVGDE